MYEQLETDLIDAFSRRAAGIPAGTAVRLAQVDYHPRSSRAPLRAAGAMAGTAATAGAIVSVVVLGGSQAAFAGWRPVPTAASSGQATTAAASCQAQLEASPALSGAPAGPGWDAIATDVRGPFTVFIYENGSVNATCFTGPSFTAVSTSAPDGGSMSSGSASGAGGANSYTTGGNGTGGLVHISVAHLASAGQGPYTLVEGEVAADVSAVTVVRSDGVDVQASLAGGLFVAWWPGAQDATAADLTTPAGTTAQALSTVLAPIPPASANCGRASQTTSVTVVCSESARSDGPSTSSSGGPGVVTTPSDPGRANTGGANNGGANNGDANSRSAANGRPAHGRALNLGPR
jgi:hypothetical protein